MIWSDIIALTNNSGTTNQTSGSTHLVKGKVFYSQRAEDSGWLNVKRTKSNENGGIIGIHENVKLLYLGDKNGRSYFKVQSDIKGLLHEEVSLTQENAMKYTKKIGPESEEAILYVLYDKKTPDPKDASITHYFAKLVCNNNDIISTVTLTTFYTGSNTNFTPLPIGEHKIMAPDYPHLGASAYISKYPPLLNYNVWFPIQLDGTTGNSSRYVHVGQISHDCLTVYDVSKWNAVYDYLINRRTPGSNGMYIGKIMVSGKWN